MAAVITFLFTDLVGSTESDERTVETHLRNAYAKLGVKFRLELTRLGRELTL